MLISWMKHWLIPKTTLEMTIRSELTKKVICTLALHDKLLISKLWCNAISCSLQKSQNKLWKFLDRIKTNYVVLRLATCLQPIKDSSVHEAPINVKSQRRSDHIGFIVQSFTSHCKKLFPQLEPATSRSHSNNFTVAPILLFMCLQPIKGYKVVATAIYA